MGIFLHWDASPPPPSAGVFLSLGGVNTDPPLTALEVAAAAAGVPRTPGERSGEICTGVFHVRSLTH